MKKLKLNLSSMKGVEFLTREQLKTISGGSSGMPCVDSSACGPLDYCFITPGVGGICIPMDPGGSGATCWDAPQHERCTSQHYGCCPPSATVGCVPSTLGGYHCL